MKIVTNEPLVAKRKKQANVVSLSAMGLLIGGLVWNLTSINDSEFNILKFYGILTVLMLGFVMSSISANLVNRWVRAPRADQSLADTLKGLDNKNVLFNYTTPVPHILMAQNKIYIITPKHMDGQISVDQDKWTRNWSWMRVLRGFAEESIKSTTVEAERNVHLFNKFLEGHLPDESESLPIEPLIVFTHPKVDLRVNDSSITALTLKQLKNHVRKAMKGSALSADLRRRLTDAFSQEIKSDA